MTRDKIVIYGIGSLGVKLFEYNKRDNLFEILGFVDDKENLEPLFCGLPTMSYEQFKSKYNPYDCKVFIAIGYVKCNYFRELIFHRVINDGYELVNYVSPNSICFEGVLKGHNILVCDNVFVGHGSIIEDGVILSVGCTLSHENTIERFTFVSSCVVFGGYSKAKRNSFIGIHSTIKDGITISEFNIVGAGTNVLKSTESYSLTVGNPGKTRKADTLNITI